MKFKPFLEIYTYELDRITFQNNGKDVGRIYMKQFRGRDRYISLTSRFWTNYEENLTIKFAIENSHEIQA